tara:strand:+ start:1952 stop:2260 length:309 start_codon:yes stop_codon:yes gene_type:complete
MKDIYEVIQREKMRTKRDREYIQLLQQIADKSEMAHDFVKDVKTQRFLDKLYKDNIIQLDDYFKYSGKRETKKGFTIKPEENAYSKPMEVNNDMSKYKLNKK